MTDPLRPRVYRPYGATYRFGALFVAGILGLVAACFWLGLTEAEAIERVPGGNANRDLFRAPGLHPRFRCFGRCWS